MNNIVIKILAGLFVFSIHSIAGELISTEYCVARSEEVFNGSFKIHEVTKIRIVKSNQKSVYPLPDHRLVKGSDALDDQKFLTNFKKELSNPKVEQVDLIKGGDSSFHIIVEFEDGNNACLHGRITNFGFSFQPIFKGDSFGRRSNNLYNLIYLAVNKVS